jgi:hypothetical protein
MEQEHGLTGAQESHTLFFFERKSNTLYSTPLVEHRVTGRSHCMIAESTVLYNR